jgi:hypothetical protein
MSTKISKLYKAGLRFLLCVAFVVCSVSAFAEGWSGIEPLKSNRDDVERVLGKPTSTGPDGSMTFKVSGGTVTIYFVDSKFVTVKKLDPKLEGTVLQIVLQHDKSSDTPQSLGLGAKFEHDAGKGADVYRNLHDGISYTFVNGQLKTTRYMVTTDQLAKARKG